MLDIQSLTDRARDLSQKVDWWNSLMVWALVVAAVAAVAVVMATRFVILRAGQLADIQEQRVADMEHNNLALRGQVAGLETEASSQKERAANAEKSLKEVELKTEGFRLAIAQANERASKAQESLGLAEQHSAEANAKAEGFRLDIATANQRAAEANRIAEQERLARLQLEARFADRVITPAQEQGLEKAFAVLKGKTVDVKVFGDTMEITHFSGKILDCMRKAGVLINFSRPLGGASVRGVLVGVRADAPNEFKRAAESFISILQQTVGEGVTHWDFEQLVSTSVAVGGSDKGAEPNSPMRIWIGSK